MLYAQQQQQASHEKMGSGSDKIALIFNMGASYCDVTVTATVGGVSQIKALAGNVVGGEDLLQSTMHHLLPDSPVVVAQLGDINEGEHDSLGNHDNTDHGGSDQGEHELGGVLDMPPIMMMSSFLIPRLDMLAAILREATWQSGRGRSENWGSPPQAVGMEEEKT